MTLLWYSYIFFIYFPFIKLQITDININSINQSSNISEFDNFILKTSHITILGALSNAEHIEILNNTIIYSNKDISISSQSFIIDSNPLLTMSDLCDIGNISNAKIIIAGRPIDNENDNDLALTAISYVSDFYHIPVLTIASRENIFSDTVNIIK
jgi:hypothetical protein